MLGVRNITDASACGVPCCCRPDREVLLKAIHSLSEAAGVVKEDWNGYNIIHDNASRVAALDIGFAPSANARKYNGPVKMVYLLGADDYADADVPADAFVVYQVRRRTSC